MVIVHDTGILLWLPLLVIAVAVLGLLISGVLVVDRNFRLAKRTALTTLGGVAVWLLVVHAIALLAPRTIVKVGESYCEDINCLGIDEVHAQAGSSATVYKLNVHIFSDANTVKVSFKDFTLYLMDERGRHFPLVNDTSVVPYDSILDPHQSIKTSLTFAVAPDARQLFLTWDHQTPQNREVKPHPVWAPLIGWVMYGGSGYLLQKQAVLRVL